MSPVKSFLVVFSCAGLAVFLAGCVRSEADAGVTATGPTLVLPFYNSADLTPKWFTRAAAAAEGFHRVASFALTDQTGEPVDESRLSGKITVVNFFFATCGLVCPAMTRQLKQVEAEFHDDPGVFLLSHSVMPEVDTATVLRGFARQYRIDSEKWCLLTGDRSTIYKLARRSYFADDGAKFQQPESDFLHTENVYLLDHQRRIRGVYSGTRPMDIRRLIEDIRELQKEPR